MTISLPRGMRDIDSKEMSVRLWIYEKIKDIIKRYGFQLVEPSAIEYLETLQAQAGEDIKNEIFWFKDKAGRDIGLRFDLTVGMTRMAASDATSIQPIKIACISNMWRYDEPQFARYRCFYQWDLEIYGSKEVEADLEVISVGIDVLEALGLKEFEVRISNRKLIEGFLEFLGISDEKQKENVMRVIDKKRKLSEEELVNEFKKYGLEDSQVKTIMSFINNIGKSGIVIKKIKEIGINNEKFNEGLKELMKLFYILQVVGREKYCVIDTSIVRGIGYYTGNVFECYDKGNEDIGAIWAGGRFDNLSKAYGRDMPAVGIAGGIERLILSLERNKLIPENLLQVPKVFVASVNDDMRERVLEIVDFLRKENISVEFDIKHKNLSRQLEYANSKKIPYVIIVGPEEVKSKKLKLKIMDEKIEKMMSLKEIVNMLKT
jgi:histidyl-tRNA synthetase